MATQHIVVDPDRAVVRRRFQGDVIIDNGPDIAVVYARHRLSFRTFFFFVDSGTFMHDWAFLPLRGKRLRTALVDAGWRVIERRDVLRKWGSFRQFTWSWQGRPPTIDLDA